MMRTRSLKVLVALVLAGCGGECTPEPEYTLSIVSPASGLLVNLADDVSPQDEGVQLETVVLAEYLDGVTVTLQALEGELHDISPGLVVDGTARIHFTLDAAVTFVATASLGGRQIESAPISLDFDPNPRACRVVSPANGAVLASPEDVAEDDGFQVDVSVRCVGVDSGTPFSLRVNGGPVGEIPLDGEGIARFETVDLAEGPNALEAVELVADDETEAPQEPDAKDESDEIESDEFGETDDSDPADDSPEPNGPIRATSSVEVRTGACRLVISPPSGTVFNARGEGPHEEAVADRHPGAPMNARIPVEHGCAGATLELRLADGDAMATILSSLKANDEPFAFDVELPDGELLVRAVAIDHEGNEGDTGGGNDGAPLKSWSPRVRWLVDSVVPEARITHPVDGALLSRADDVSDAPGLQMPIRGDFSGIAPGTPFDLVLGSDADAERITTGEVGEDGTFEVEITLPAGIHVLSARAARPSGTTATSPPAMVTVLHTDASIAIASPVPGATLTLADDASDEPGFQIHFELMTTQVIGGASLPGNTGEVACNGLRAPFTVLPNGSANALLTVPDAPCGGVVLQCSARLETVDGPVESEELSLLVDPTPPGVTLLTPSEGTLFPTHSATFELVADCVGEAQHASVSIDGVVVSEMPVVDGAAVLGPVTLPHDDVLATVSVRDAAGNATQVQRRLLVDVGIPVVEFVDPPAGTLAVFGPGDDMAGTIADGLQRTIVVAVDDEAPGTAVELRIGGGAPRLTGTVASNGRLLAIFTNVTLPEGDSVLRACAGDAAGNVGCAEQAIRVVTERPTCDLLSPADGLVLGTRDVAPGTSGPAVDVVVQTDMPDGVAVALDVTHPQGNTQTLTSAATQGLARFDGVGLASEGTWTLVARCLLEPLPGMSVPSHVTVDLTGPSADILEPQENALFNLASTDQSAAPGFQIAVEVASDDLSTGVLATLVVDCGSAAAPQSHGPQSVANDGIARFTVTLPDDATCDLVATLEDAVGNVGDEAVRRIRVDRVPPEVTFTAPEADALLGSPDDANPMVPGFQLASIHVQLTGARSTNPAVLRVNGVVIGGGVSSPGGSEVEWTNVTLQEGVNDFEVIATDDAGNTAVATRQVTVDTEAPSVAITSPADGSTLNRASDGNPNASGVQHDVHLSGTELVAGTIVRVCSQQGTANTTCASGGALLTENTLIGGSPLIPLVTFPEGLVTFHVEVEDALGNIGSSPSVTITVDSIPPVVSELQLVQVVDGVEIVLDTQGNQATFGSAHDSAPAQPGFQTRLRARVDGVEPGLPGDEWRQVRFISTNPAPGTVLGTATIGADGWAVLDTTLADGGHRIHVTARDRANNPASTPDAPIPGFTPLTLNFAIDTAAPSVALLTPTGGTFLVRHADGSTDDADPTTPGMQIDVTVGSNAGAGNPVEVLVDGVVAATATLPSAGTSVTVRITVADGLRELVARATNDLGNTGNSQPVTIFVDGTPPVLNLHAPAPGTLFGAGGVPDADLTAPGFQIAVEVEAAHVDDGQPVTLLSSLGGELFTLFTAPMPPSPGNACDHDPSRFCVLVTVKDGSQTLIATAEDASGNFGESPAVPIDVVLTPPTVWFASDDDPLFFGVETADGDTCRVAIDVLSTAFGGSLELFANDVSAASITAAFDGSGTFTDLVIANGDRIELRVRAEDGSGEGWSSPRDALCDLSEPTVAFASPVPDGVILYVAFGNPGDIPNAIADKFPSNELEADFTLDITGAVNGTLELSSDRDGILYSGPIDANGPTTLTDVSIASPGAHELTATVRNSIGNTNTARLSIHSAVIPPGPANLPQYAQVLDGRISLVSLSFVAPATADSGDGTVIGYLVHHADAPIDSEAAWLAATPIVPAYDTPVAPGELQTLTLEGLPFEAVHHIAVRAMDATGNLGPLTPNSIADLLLTREALDAPPPGTFVQVRQVVADLDADGFDDLVVSSSVADGGEGVVFIYYGGAGAFGSPVVLKGTRIASDDDDFIFIAGRFGSSLAVGDVNGDGFTDLVVGAEYEHVDANDPSTREGAVHVFFGALHSRLSSSSVADARIYGPPNSGSLGGIGPQVAVTPDLSGDGVDDLVIGSNFENGRRGRVHIVAGRTSWPATLRTSTHDPVTHQNVQLVDALAVLYADWPTEFSLTNGPSFGNRLAVMGDLDGDGFGDIAISASGGSFPADVSARRPVYIVSGRLARGVVAAERISTTISAPIPRSQFGLDLAAGDWTGDGAADLAVIEAAGVRLYNGAALGQTIPQTVQDTPVQSGVSQFTTLLLPGPTSAPAVVRNLGDVNGDGIDDIAASQVGPTAPINEVLVWFGRTGGAWGPQNVLIPGNGRPNFGVGMDAGRLTGSPYRDIAVLDLGSQVTVLSGP